VQDALSRRRRAVTLTGAAGREDELALQAAAALAGDFAHGFLRRSFRLREPTELTRPSPRCWGAGAGGDGRSLFDT